MRDQQDFEFEDWEDEPDAPYQRHSETSRAAAEAIEPDAATLRGQVLAFIRGRGSFGSTDEESQMGLRMNPSTERPRRIELWRAGWIKDSGRTRYTRSGRSAVVWVDKKIEEPR